MSIDYQWLSTDEAAKILGLRPSTLRKWREIGKGPPYHKYSGWGERTPCMYDRKQLDEWIKSRRVDEVKDLQCQK